MRTLGVFHRARRNDRNPCRDTLVVVAPGTVAGVFLIHHTVRDDVVGVHIRLVDKGVNTDKQRELFGIGKHVFNPVINGRSTEKNVAAPIKERFRGIRIFICHRHHHFRGVSGRVARKERMEDVLGRIGILTLFTCSLYSVESS